MYIVYIWLTGLAGGRAVPPDVREERPLSICSLPSTGVQADVFLQCLTTLVMSGNGLSRPGGNLGFRV